MAKSLLRGNSNAEIAAELGFSTNRARNLTQLLYRKFNIDDRYCKRIRLAVNLAEYGDVYGL